MAESADRSCHGMGGKDGSRVECEPVISLTPDGFDKIVTVGGVDLDPIATKVPSPAGNIDSSVGRTHLESSTSFVRGPETGGVWHSNGVGSMGHVLEGYASWAPETSDG